MRKTSLIFLCLLAVTSAAHAGPPDWLRAVAQDKLPDYPAETSFVILLDETYTTVTDKGEMKTDYRRAYKILTTKGRSQSHVVLAYDNDTEISDLNAWAIPPKGSTFDVSGKDAVETGISSSSLYSDQKKKILVLPTSEPGTVIGYEYKQTRRADVLEDVWDFQDVAPVHLARYTLALPSGWEYKMRWSNWASSDPTRSDKQRFSWQITDLPAIKEEPSMPAWRAVAGRLSLKVIPSDPALKSRQRETWNDVAAWYSTLSAPRLASDPKIKAKVAELTAGKADTWSKMKALAAYAQRNIRYVAIEIGIGGYQPHFASEVLSNTYGDCKDKATLLDAMLREIGVDSYLLLTHTTRDVVTSDFAAMQFNHEIIAIRLPESLQTDEAVAVIQHPKLGRLLLFDPTSSLTPIGLLPGYLQGGRGLLVADHGGELISFPELPPANNVLRRNAKFRLTEDGGLVGEVEEVRTGDHANYKRHELMELAAPERTKSIAEFLSGFMQDFVVKDLKLENLEDFDRQLVVRYTFEAPHYASNMGKIWLLRPRVIGSKAEYIFSDEPRSYPLDLDTASLQNDRIEITLPPSFSLEDSPAGIDLRNDFVRYTSSYKMEGSVLHYDREYEVRKVSVPLDHFAEIKSFYRAVAADERGTVLLKQSN
jgi:transglutaminase-like putative cysteine protease